MKAMASSNVSLWGIEDIVALYIYTMVKRAVIS